MCVCVCVCVCIYVVWWLSVQNNQETPTFYLTTLLLFICASVHLCVLCV